MNYDNPHKRSWDNSDFSGGGPPFKRQRGSFRGGNQNFNNSGRSNFNRGGRGSFPGRQNFNRGRLGGPYHGGQSYNQGGRGGRGGGGRGSFRGQRGGGYFPRGGGFPRGGRGSFPRHRGGPFRNSSPRKSESNNVIEVTFPNIKGSYKEVFTEVLDNCNMILRPRPITSTCSIDEVKEKMALLKEITIDGNKLNITVSSSSIHPQKKTIQLPEKFSSQTERIKNFFGAESIEPVKSYKDDRYIPMHILTFTSEQEARDAASKYMNLNNHFTIGLKPYYNVETLYSDAEEKTDMDAFDEKAKAIVEKLNSEAEMEETKKEKTEAESKQEEEEIDEGVEIEAAEEAEEDEIEEAEVEEVEEADEEEVEEEADEE